MSKVHIRLELDTPQVLNRFDQRFQRAQKYLDSEVLRCSAPYVPMRDGNLMKSGTLGTKLGSGQVIYNAPYAKKMYYGLNYHFSKDKHPQACAQWFEKAKATSKDDWMNGVGKIITGGDSNG